MAWRCCSSEWAGPANSHSVDEGEPFQAFPAAVACAATGTTAVRLEHELGLEAAVHDLPGREPSTAGLGRQRVVQLQGSAVQEGASHTYYTLSARWHIQVVI
eukprot:CAMPEP_0175091988 /NCGR_PEP_ID=MMETSP0086_2-20121207/2212_1 /TAXON_ID=136419 /ORGANISM="Unknown Unknown, Strain D1" /LENGTH=101 /DNA_ID=CAMNT_0016364799 /DNA_START=1262 /DNA_END=1565 /DNA_ORIENTATION=+